MNVKLLRKVQKHILEEPKRFAMGTWKSLGKPGTRAEIGQSWNAQNPYENGQEFPQCGTIACIGVWMKQFDPTCDLDGWGDKLVTANQWPTKFRSRYAKAKTALTRAKIASARIDHFIKTKGAE